VDDVLGQSVAEYGNVILEHVRDIDKETFQDPVHVFLKIRGAGSPSERKPAVFVIPKWCVERRGVAILLLELNVAVRVFDVDLGEEPVERDAIEHYVCQWDIVEYWDGYGIEGNVVDAHPHRAVCFWCKEWLAEAGSVGVLYFACSKLGCAVRPK
jgi:hypothetical protein